MPRKEPHLSPDTLTELCVLSSSAQPVLRLGQGGVHVKMWVKITQGNAGFLPLGSDSASEDNKAGQQWQQPCVALSKLPNKHAASRSLSSLL